MSFQFLSINSLDSREITNIVEELECTVNQSYQFTERADLSRNLDSVMEAQFIELNYKPSYILIGVICRPPNDNYKLYDNLQTLLK